MAHWSNRELGRLRMILERERGASVYEMAREASKTLRGRTVNSIHHKLRELISHREFNSDTIELEGEEFPAQVVSGYVVITLPGGSKEFAHRFVWSKHNGEIPPHMHVHHVNGSRIDNRIQNLSLTRREICRGKILLQKNQTTSKKGRHQRQINE